jgi:dienelactone hydrolase
VNNLFALSLLCLTISAADLRSTESDRSLPLPTGTFAVGRVHFYWTDQSRSEPLSTKPGTRRKLIVSVWYPAEPGQTAGKAAYLPGSQILNVSPLAADMRRSFGRVWPLVASGDVGNNTWEDAPVHSGSFPVLTFSHGYGVSGFEYSSMIADIASHGYVVAMVEHTFESGPVVLPDGSVVGISPISARHTAPPGPDVPFKRALSDLFNWERKRADEWASDTRFILEKLRLLEHESNGMFSYHLDMARTGVFGHSIGGRFAVRACQLDARIRACASLDGGSLQGLYLNFPGTGPPTQPVLFLDEENIEPKLPPPSDDLLRQMHETRQEFEDGLSNLGNSPINSCRIAEALAIR